MTLVLDAHMHTDEFGGGEGGVSAEPPTVAVSMNEPAPVQYDVMADLMHANMFKTYSEVSPSG